MAPERVLTVPNCITFGRFGLIPVFVLFHLAQRPGWALATFVVAAASDGIDGLLARLLDQRTKLGGLLDPIADKLLVFAALCTLVVEKRLPAWLLGLVVFRDAFMGVGALVVKWKNLEIPAAPSRIGKYATFTLTVLVALALVDQIVGESEDLHAYTRVVGFIAALCVAISTVQYLVRFGYLFFVPTKPEAQGR